MSLFGALMGDLDDDPFMGGHMRRMNSMMNSFFRDPFGDMMGRPMSSSLVPFEGMREGRRNNEISRFGDFGMGFPLMPMGFPNLGNIFQSVGNNPNCHSFTSSTVMTMTPGPDGRPQIYQASQSVKQGPGGIRETKKTVADSRTGVKKMAIGHHINDRGHIIEREQNVYSGEREEREDFINLDEDEAESFNREWESKARAMARNNAIGYAQSSGRRSQREPQLALPPSSSNQHNSTRQNARSSRPINHCSSFKPSTATLVASDSEDDEEEEEEEEKQGVKRKLVAEVISSEEEEEDAPQPKRRSLVTPSPSNISSPKSTSPQPTPSSSSSASK